MYKVLFCCAIAAWMIPVATVQAQWTILDDFDRMPAVPSDIGSAWTQQTPDLRFELVNQEVGSAGRINALMTYDGFSGPIGFTLNHSGNTSDAQYGAAVVGFDEATGDHLMIKILDAGLGGFYRVAFQYGDSGAGWPGMTGGLDYEDISYDAADWFTDARVRVGLDTIARTVTVEIDVLNGGPEDLVWMPDYVFTRGNVPLGLGDGVGLGAYGAATMDDFEGCVPEPATMMLLVIGSAGLLKRRRS